MVSQTPINTHQNTELESNTSKKKSTKHNTWRQSDIYLGTFFKEESSFQTVYGKDWLALE